MKDIYPRKVTAKQLYDFAKKMGISKSEVDEFIKLVKKGKIRDQAKSKII